MCLFKFCSIQFILPLLLFVLNFKSNKFFQFAHNIFSLMDKRILIVGGGVIGCSTAFYLTKLGHKNVTVIEAGFQLLLVDWSFGNMEIWVYELENYLTPDLRL